MRFERPELEREAAEIHERSVVVDGHCHLTKWIAARREQGEKGALEKECLPYLRAGGVRVLLLLVGGDNNAMVNGTDLLLWGTLGVIDHCYQEIEACAGEVTLCRKTSEIDEALRDGRIAVIMGLEGGRPLEGRPMQDSLTSLRTFHRLGVRSVQLTGNGRNRLADGVAEARTNGGLTRFGVSVVKEMNRLGMLVDISHLAPAGVFEVMDLSEGAVVASHCNARAICDHPRNLTDEVIRLVAETGGVVGLTFFSTLINRDKDLATAEDLAEHIDHISELVGVEHVGLGPDFSEFPVQISQWSGARGDMEGVEYGNKERYFHPNLRDWRDLPNLTGCLLKKGYSTEAVQMILGANFLRVYREVFSD